MFYLSTAHMWFKAHLRISMSLSAIKKKYVSSFSTYKNSTTKWFLKFWNHHFYLSQAAEEKFTPPKMYFVKPLLVFYELINSFTCIKNDHYCAFFTTRHNFEKVTNEIGILELTRQSSILVGHWLIVMTRSVKGAVEIIFDTRRTISQFVKISKYIFGGVNFSAAAWLK